MIARFRNLIAFALLGLLVACGGGGNSAVPGTGLSPLPAPVPPPAAGTLSDGRLDTLVEWARASQDVPAMAIVIVANDQIAEMAAVGQRSAQADEPVTTDDMWHIGSLTKAMTATLAGVLVDQSIVNWNTTPLDIWPELDQSITPEFRAITLKQLLSHTAGIRRADAVPAKYAQDAPESAMEKRRAFAADLLVETAIGPVGTDSYSNGGYVVAAAMLETVMATPWELLLTQQVFGPLGMLESGFGAPGTPGVIDQPWGHLSLGDDFRPVSPGPDADNPDTLGPAGTVHATLRDYGNFMLAHIAGARGVDGLLTARTYEVLHTPIDNGSAPGWGVSPFEDWAEGPVLSHAGSNQRWFAIVRLAPALNGGVMVVVNAGGGRAQAAIEMLDELILERFEASQ